MAEPSQQASRYAIYFAPAPQSPWWRFGTGLLAPQANADGSLSAFLAHAGIDPSTWRSMAANARRYGFHATLKAPFRLTSGATLPELMERISALAASLRAVALGNLEPAAFPGFVALAPLAAPPALTELAARCVIELDDLRAPALPCDIARRRPERLDRRGLELLHAYGYPLVLERFRFHMTLAGCERADLAERLIQALSPLTAALNREAPPRLDRLCLFEEPARGAAFQRRRDWVLSD
jgi:hypothetical protein